MKLKKAVQILLIPGIIYLTGCNSSTYEIEEIEEPVDVTQQSVDTAATSNSVSEIKETISQDIKNESKFSDKQIISKVYSVQLGAFKVESNAVNLNKKAKSMVTQEIYYKNVEGMYKVRAGSFNSVSDAADMLQQAKNLGFNDSFVVELTYVQTIDK